MSKKPYRRNQQKRKCPACGRRVQVDRVGQLVAHPAKRKCQGLCAGSVVLVEAIGSVCLR